MAAGALLLLGPALLKTRFHVDEVVTTLLLNFIALLFVSMLLDGPMKDPAALGWPQSVAIPAELELPQARRALARALGPADRARRSRCSCGSSTASPPSASRCAPSAPTRAPPRSPACRCSAVVVKTALLSGALAGLAGCIEVAGRAGYVTLDMSPGYGYSGIVIAMLAQLNPLAVVAAAIFVAGILVGADSMSRAIAVPTYIADVIVAASLHRRCWWRRCSRATGSAGADAWPATSSTSSRAPRSGSRCCASPRRSIFGTLGVLLCERAGVLNLGIEGIMVVGAFTGWLAVYQGAGLWTGVLRRRARRRGARPAARDPHRAARRCRSTCRASASRCSGRASRPTPIA